MEIENRVVVVTGASSGIGEATARLAHARGALVVLAARRAERLAALASQLPGALSVPTDVTRPEDRDRLVSRALEVHGGIDVLVNNAGQGLHQPLEMVDPDDFRAVLELNLVAPLALMRAVIPGMRARGGGAIVNVSSGTSRLTLPGVGAYAASKSALNKLSEVARVELDSDGIVVSLVQPSITDTEFHDHLRAGRMSAQARAIVPDPPELVAEAILRAIKSGDPEVELQGRGRAAASPGWAAPI